MQQPAILATAAHHLIHLEQRVGHPFGNSAAIYAGNQPYHRTKHFSVDYKLTEIPILRRAVEYPVAADYGGGHIKVSINQAS